MLTDDEIENAKKETKRVKKTYIKWCIEQPPFHEHNDCIRIAYEWLDAQKKIKTIPKNLRYSSLKEVIEEWAGRYVSKFDVEVAATLHPDIKGEYPFYNFSQSFLTEPSRDRLDSINEAFTQSYNEHHDPKLYNKDRKLTLKYSSLGTNSIYPAPNTPVLPADTVPAGNWFSLRSPQ